jgi:hypothetical protein
MCDASEPEDATDDTLLVDVPAVPDLAPMHRERQHSLRFFQSSEQTERHGLVEIVRSLSRAWLDAGT